MIGSLRGTLVSKRPPWLTLDVGGVGYELEAPMSTFYRLPDTGRELMLVTHLVVREDAHALYGFFTEAELKTYPNMEAARDGLRKSETDLLFGDGFALSFWLNGTDSAGCCVFVGGPFTESRNFGEGVGIAIKRGNDTLRLAFNWALFRLWEKGRFTDLWLRYFPISPF